MSSSPRSSVSLIDSQVRRATRISLMANGTVLLLLGIAGWYSSNYYFLFFRGPTAATDQELLELAKNPRNGGLLEYVELHDRKLNGSGWKEISTADDAVYAEATWYLTPVGDQELLVLAKSQEDGAHLIGPVAALREMEQSIVAKIEAEQPEMRGRILPIMLNHTAAFPVAGYLGLAIAIPILLISIWNILRPVLRARSTAGLTR